MRPWGGARLAGRPPPPADPDGTTRPRGGGSFPGRRLRRSKHRGRRHPLRTARPARPRGGPPRTGAIAGAWKRIEERGNFEGRWSLKEINDRVHEAEPIKAQASRSQAMRSLRGLGHDVMTVYDQGLPEPRCWVARGRGRDYLLSLDLDFSKGERP